MTNQNEKEKRTLTHQELTGLEPVDGNRKEIWDDKVSGLYVRVYPSGTKSFLLRIWYKGSNLSPVIGRFPSTTLKQAREKAREMKHLKSKGVNPKRALNKEGNKNRKESKTFSDLADLYIENHLPDLAKSTQKNRKSRIQNQINPEIGNMVADEITVEDIEDLQDQVISKAKNTGNADPDDENAGYTMANRVVEDVSVILNKTKPKLDNPCKYVETKDERSVRNPFDKSQLPTVWDALDREPEITGAVGKMILLTGQREAEVRRMEWQQLREDYVWEMTNVVRKKKKKDKKTLLLPLPPLAQRIIDNLRPKTGTSKYVFCSERHDHDEHIQSLSRARKRVNDRCDFDNGRFQYKRLRTTVRTNLPELKIEPHIANRIIKHDVQTTAYEHYDDYYYLEEQRRALAAWDRELRTVIGIDENSIIGDIYQIEKDLDDCSVDEDKKSELKPYLDTIKSLCQSSDPNEKILEEAKHEVVGILEDIAEENEGLCPEKYDTLE